MPTPDALTIRRVNISSGAALTQDEFNQLLRNAIEQNPTIVIRTIEALSVLTGPLVENQVAFVDSEMDAATNGVYGYKEDRSWRQILGEADTQASRR